MTPELGIENAKKHLLFYLDTMSREDALVLLNRLHEVIKSMEHKIARGEPVKRKTKTRQG